MDGVSWAARQGGETALLQVGRKELNQNQEKQEKVRKQDLSNC